MPAGQLPLLFIFALGIAAKNNVITAAAGILLIIQVMSLERLYPILESRSVDLGLLFLTIAILVPLATGRIQMVHILGFLWSAPGVVTLIGGAIAAVLNARGVSLLTMEPDVIGAIIIGSLISIAFFGGIPVGPVMAAGIASVLLGLFRWLF